MLRHGLQCLQQFNSCSYRIVRNHPYPPRIPTSSHMSSGKGSSSWAKSCRKKAVLRKNLSRSDLQMIAKFLFSRIRQVPHLSSFGGEATSRNRTKLYVIWSERSVKNQVAVASPRLVHQLLPMDFHRKVIISRKLRVSAMRIRLCTYGWWT